MSKGRIMKQTDQYSEKIPDDLVVLPEVNGLTIKGLETVLNADWYEARMSQEPEDPNDITPYLMASAKEIKAVIHNDWQDMDLEIVGGIVIEILSVNDCLKRWSIEDGFYHA